MRVSTCWPGQGDSNAIPLPQTPIPAHTAGWGNELGFTGDFSITLGRENGGRSEALKKAIPPLTTANPRGTLEFFISLLATTLEVSHHKNEARRLFLRLA